MSQLKQLGFRIGGAVLALACLPLVSFAETGSMAKSPAAAQPLQPLQLVREVTYNELRDHEKHGYWRYWIQRHSGNDTQLQQQVETVYGPIQRATFNDGRPLSAGEREAEDRRIQHLLNSPGEQAQQRKDYAEDERRIGRILALLPDAFLYEAMADEPQSQDEPDCACYHYRYRPNPDYPTHTVEARIFHAMSGELWIGKQSKRLVRLDGRLQENVDFGFGILGRMYKDGWFRMERTRVGSSNAGDWKIRRLEVHLQGRALLLKTIAKETSQIRGGFTPVPLNLTLQQAAVLVGEPVAAPKLQSTELVAAHLP